MGRVLAIHATVVTPPAGVGIPPQLRDDAIFNKDIKDFIHTIGGIYHSTALDQ
jgi:hypothetical protein